ncbi:MAG TPA: PQQ-dependent sugar dehydrogenase [Vicinamibacterales bacterium]
MSARSRLALVCAIALLATAVVPLSAALTDLRLLPYASGFSSPVAFVQDPADPQVHFVVEQGGRIRVLVGRQLQPTDFLNLAGSTVSGGEQGLLGLAFPPDAATSGRFYVNFTDRSGNTVVARFKRSADPRVADPTSRVDLLWSTGQRFIRQPYANHNGGCLAFGPDGYLYIGMGDGGSGDDPQNRAQDLTTLLGKILRIDVSVSDSDPAGFRIPPDNPFASSARPEIWDLGVRNPWRFSFDDVARGGTGALVIGDVGQNQWEEVNYEPRGRGGRNYGWRIREGANAHIAGTPAFLPLIDPVHQYDHATGNSITGGYIYRGAFPDARGRYFFADFVRARIWSAAVATDGTGEASFSDFVEHTPLITTGTALGNVSSFGVDAAGEIYVVDYSRGAILLMHGFPPPTPNNLRIIQ